MEATAKDERHRTLDYRLAIITIFGYKIGEFVSTQTDTPQTAMVLAKRSVDLQRGGHSLNMSGSNWRPVTLEDCPYCSHMHTPLN
jgi:hypothetical protein